MRATITLFALLVAFSLSASANGDLVKECVLANAENPAFLSLRSKMTLLISDEQSFGMLANSAKPTKPEKKLIGAWASEFERCSKLGRAQRDASQFGRLVSDYHAALIGAAANLYASKISYAQYAKEQQEMFVQLERKAALLEAAKQQQIAAQQAEERRQYESQRQAEAQADQARRQMALQYMLNQQRPAQGPTNIIIRPQQGGIQTCIYSGTC